MIKSQPLLESRNRCKITRTTVYCIIDSCLCDSSRSLEHARSFKISRVTAIISWWTYLWLLLSPVGSTRSNYCFARRETGFRLCSCLRQNLGSRAIQCRISRFIRWRRSIDARCEHNGAPDCTCGNN